MTDYLTPTATPRVVNIDHGFVMVVTDLHGDWPLYQRYRDVFLRMRARGLLDTLVFTGDFIHSEGPPETDKSLEIVLDLIELREELGSDLVVLLGNHEMPHLYAVVLSKGDHVYTPRFEATMATHRERILAFFDTLPFYVRTQAGVSISHAGAFSEAHDPQTMTQLFGFSHRLLWEKVAAYVPVEHRAQFRAQLAALSEDNYNVLVQELFAVNGPDDPRYDDYLISQFVLREPAFELLWSALFVRNESEYGKVAYANHVSALLRSLSEGYVRQSVLVAGHIGCRGGYRTLARGQQLRLASGAHAHPYTSARYLIFDAEKPLANAEALLPGTGSVVEP
jgi:hypothetical protein